MKSDSPSEINPQDSSSEANEQVVNQINEQGDNILTEENGNATTNPIEVDIAVLADLSQQIETLKAQLEDRSVQYMRIAADFENYRKRTAKEKEEIDLQVKRNTITELLPVVDNFERARAHLKPQGDGEMTIHKSYQGVYKQLVDCLKRLGVAPMRPEGQEFDPNLHEAVMREPTDEHPEGTVLEELVRGYYFGDRVLRHAMVKVAAPKEDISVDSEDLSNQDNS
ncbi:nucleotide exchange factor GrpE [Dolichospermum sp. LEGE 00240]|jgi:molecular chaperone GrpE|uniref:nucleotide exchange factor GrpE n=1 Tax=Dolichospermum sp. LEGE 00240 TaxID=1828603 RepID=UPI001882BDB6|nr:nucleotide exchange factor GrpE [Dolichospermum sp. LEGE 00240]MDM3843585.1 nucleotide exchange factor GrpE [Aphanizomenon gracile PMC638.10]MDM3851238.1 nucleotide exchange factor GrpE [Aphanizomenon gracile PMC627.10]MDM3854138.1 nucleotide exchange factor GrpE [Aphanizomenon gracile PMC649.10]MDM3860187.1 nucleotide exchange factor GrpE [Aphanizomenon gracile PMC644.10]MBE9249828.1 nucleotide exchange factor GrpE [Dolichospermum sp. LEGE 00240]